MRAAIALAGTISTSRTVVAPHVLPHARTTACEHPCYDQWLFSADSVAAEAWPAKPDGLDDVGLALSIASEEHGDAAVQLKLYMPVRRKSTSSRAVTYMCTRRLTWSPARSAGKSHPA